MDYVIGVAIALVLCGGWAGWLTYLRRKWRQEFVDAVLHDLKSDSQ